MTRPADEHPPAGGDWRNPSADWRRHWQDPAAPAGPPPAGAAEGEFPFESSPRLMASLRRGRPASRRRLFWALALGVGACAAVLGVLALFPVDHWGNVVRLGGLEVYYGRGVQEAEARALASFLREQGVAEEGPATARLSRTEKGYGLYLFVEPGVLDDPEALADLESLRQRAGQEVFAGRPVVLYLCDRGVGVTPYGQLKEPVVRKVLE